MYETESEVTALQELLDRSHAGATEHLQAIIHDERRLTAADLVALLTGMKVLSVATVTAGGEPRISALDGHFLHATWSFSTSGTAAKARQLAARPQTSVAHIDGEECWVQGEWHHNNFRVRQQILEGSKDGTIQVLCNRFVLREGVDAPWLAHTWQIR